MKNKLWVVNPYKDKYRGIQYKPEMQMNIFEALLNSYAYNKEIDMSPIYIDNLDEQIYDMDGQKINALYKKVEDDNFYMIGDNRDNSSDSRFLGFCSISFNCWTTMVYIF